MLINILRDETTDRDKPSLGKHIYMSQNIVHDVEYYKFACQEIEKLVKWDMQAIERDKLRYMLKPVHGVDSITHFRIAYVSKVKSILICKPITTNYWKKCINWKVGIKAMYLCSERKNCTCPHQIILYMSKIDI
jgi:hypothetical protein